MANGTVVITGGDGYVSRRVAARYLRGTSFDVLLAVRATSTADLAAKRAKVAPLAGLAPGRVTTVAADLTREDALGGLDPLGVRHVVHSAAVTRFDVDQDTARRSNVEGTRRVLDFAARCPDLESVGLVSTLYASGLRPGVVPEELGTDGSGFANYYEWSKWQAEALSAAQFAHLPLRVLRLATVVADDPSGTVTQHNAFHNTLKLYYFGLLSLLPGDPATPLYVVTGDEAADGIWAVMHDASASGTYHLCHPHGVAVTLGDLVDLAWERFGADADFARRRVLRPVVADEDTFAIVADVAREFGSLPVRAAVASVTPFARQLYVAKQIANERGGAFLAGRPCAADPRPILANAIDHLVATRWGRRGVA
jgi:nucleoside-diphosphate-sugar epimerase